MVVFGCVCVLAVGGCCLVVGFVNIYLCFVVIVDFAVC